MGPHKRENMYSGGDQISAPPDVVSDTAKFIPFVENVTGLTFEVAMQQAQARTAKKQKPSLLDMMAGPGDVNYDRVWYVISNAVEYTRHDEPATCMIEDSSLLQRLLEMQTCTFCGVENTVPDTKFLACGQCKFVHYCSKGCQKSDWPRHKHVCMGSKKLNKAQTDLLQDSKMQHAVRLYGEARPEKKDAIKDLFQNQHSLMREGLHIVRLQNALNDFLLDSFCRDPAGNFLLGQDGVQGEIFHPHPESEMEVFRRSQGLTGTLFVYLRHENGNLRFAILRRDKLLALAKKTRDEYLEKAKQGYVDTEAELVHTTNEQRGKLMCSARHSARYWHSMVKTLSSAHDYSQAAESDQQIMLGFALKEMPLTFFRVAERRLCSSDKNSLFFKRT